ESGVASGRFGPALPVNGDESRLGRARRGRAGSGGRSGHVSGAGKSSRRLAPSGAVAIAWYTLIWDGRAKPRVTPWATVRLRNPAARLGLTCSERTRGAGYSYVRLASGIQSSARRSAQRTTDNDRGRGLAGLRTTALAL